VAVKPFVRENRRLRARSSIDKWIDALDACNSLEGGSDEATSA